MGNELIIIGSCLIIAAVLFDLFIRLRMSLRVGDKSVFLRGRAFRHGEYRAAGVKYNWAQWPVSAMWTILAIGVTCCAFGVVLVNRGTK